MDPADTKTWLEAYHTQGYAVLKNVIDAETVEATKAACTLLVDQLADKLVNAGHASERFEAESFDTRLFKLCRSAPEQTPNMWRAELHGDGRFYEFLCHKGVMSAVHELIQDADAIRIFPNYSLRPKTNLAIHEVIWHQDAGLTPSGAPNEASIEDRADAFGIGTTVNVWSPLVNATAENGCMKFVPGSQHQGILPHVVVGMYSGVGGDGEALSEDRDSKASTGAYVTSIVPEKLAPLETQAVDIPCGPVFTAPGDIVLFSNILVHRGGTNTTETVRWSFDWRFQNAAKPTLRQHNGHIVYCKDGKEKEVLSPGVHTSVLAAAADWEKVVMV